MSWRGVAGWPRTLRFAVVVAVGLIVPMLYVGLPATQAGATGTADPTVVASSNPTSIVTGQPITFSVTVTGSQGTPTGTVTFFTQNPTDSANYTICVATLDSSTGMGSCTSTNLTAVPGDDGYPQLLVFDTYSGDSNYSTGGGHLNVNVAVASTSMTLQSSANPALPNNSFTLTATVSVVAPGNVTNVEPGLQSPYVAFQVSNQICNVNMVLAPSQTVSCSFSLPAGVYAASAQFNPSFSGWATATASLAEYVQPNPHGYWLVGSDGGIFTFGTAQFFGSTGNLHLQRPVVGISPTSGEGGYWLVASDGGVFAFGNAPFVGSIPGLGLHPAGSGLAHSLNAPIVGIVPSANGQGYYMVASDGGVFAFNTAFAGSCPGIGGCSGAAVAVAPDASGNGYWLVTATGHVYTFGDAPYYGAPGPGSSPVTSMVRTPDGGGYWILVAGGTVYNYGDAKNYGSAVGSVNGLNPATAIFATSDGEGYWVASANGSVFPFGDAPNDGSMAGTKLNGAIIAATGF